MKRLSLLLGLVLVVALAACSGQDNQVQPTAEPVATPEPVTQEAPTEAPPSAGQVDPGTVVATGLPTPADVDEALVNHVWYWQSRDGEAIDNPENYTLTFNDDGTIYARFDCNVGGGEYTIDAPGSLTLGFGRSTLALCEPGSRGDELAAIFGQTVAYAFEDDGATLVLTHEDGTVDVFGLTSSEAPEITGVVWQWLGTMTGEGPISVADSTRYTIEFLEDGTAAIKADCNRVVAQYTWDGSALSIIPGPMTAAACPEDSQGDQFVTQLSGAAIGFFLDGDLYIDLFADSGTMRFSELPEVDLAEPEAGAPTGTVNAPDGVFLRTGPGTNFAAVGTAAQGDSGTLVGISVDGAWYAVDAPGFPNNVVWVAAEFVDATNAEDLPVIPTPVVTPAQLLVGPTWLWAGTTTPVNTVAVADPTRYAISFFADGTAAIKADCNRVVAQYTTDGQSITITPGPSTLALCPGDSQGDVFIQQLSNAAVFFFQGDELFIDQAAGAGTMRFVTTVATAPAPPVSGGVNGLPLRVTSFGPANAPQPVISGTEITAVFDTTASTVSGSAGCNTYTGTMIMQPGFAAGGPFATTMMFCDSPAGIMEQEAAYLAALSAVTGFQWEQQHTGNIIISSSGQVFYTLPDGTNGVINFVMQ